MSIKRAEWGRQNVIYQCGTVATTTVDGLALSHPCLQSVEGHMIGRAVASRPQTLRRTLLALTIAAVITPMAAIAQSVSGTILGTVTDAIWRRRRRRQGYGGQ